MPSIHDSARFTPGPWFVSEMHKDEVYCSRDGYFELVCEMGGNAENARLIAAAPEMYEALALAVATIERLDKKGSAVGTLDVLRAAIAKANGTSQT